MGASDADLKTYGFPPRPSLASQAYATWVTMVTAATTPVANPTLQTTNVIHGPARNLGRTGGVTSSSYLSTNWSAVGVSHTPGYFLANGSSITGVFSVPTINTSVENCSYGPYYAAIWVGFDGYGPGGNDVLQAGVNAVACPTEYQAWFEWYTYGCTQSQYACDEVIINGIQAHAGDTFFVTVTYYTASPNGNAYIVDYTTGQYTLVWYSQPNPTPSGNFPYLGNTAEWVVERPGYASNPSVLYDLADYGSSFYMEGTYNGSLAGSGPYGALDYLTMYCPPWNPSNACPLNYTTLSYVSNYNGSDGQIFFTPAGPTIQ